MVAVYSYRVTYKIKLNTSSTSVSGYMVLGGSLAGYGVGMEYGRLLNFMVPLCRS